MAKEKEVVEGVMEEVAEEVVESVPAISEGSMSLRQFSDRHTGEYGVYIIAYLEAEYRGVLKTEAGWAQELKTKIKE